MSDLKIHEYLVVPKLQMGKPANSLKENKDTLPFVLSIYFIILTLRASL
jgi:hypothetical protein